MTALIQSVRLLDYMNTRTCRVTIGAVVTEIPHQSGDALSQRVVALVGRDMTGTVDDFSAREFIGWAKQNGYAAWEANA
jgi:hypothetical protein